MDGDIYDQFGEVIDRRLGGVRAEAQRRAAAGPPPLAMFRLWQEKEEPPFGVEEVGSDEEVTQGLRGGSETEEAIIIESDDEGEEERTESPSVLFKKMKDLLDKMGRYQQKLVDLCKEVKGWRSNIPTVFLYDSGPESDFTKTAMPRGGKGTRPPQRPLGASGGYERHGPRQRESTPVYNDGDIELFLDSFWEHARRMGWTVTQAIERLRGAGRFEEPIARIRREATTRQEVEIRIEELRPSPVGPDGRPIRLEIGNVSDFIPAFEWFMQEQGIQRDDWMQTLPLRTRKAERPLAMQIRDMARDWESCRAHLREVFRRPELPQPRVERRQRNSARTVAAGSTKSAAGPAA
ncbi:hypothetical protein CBR_g10891 [Chara braunii]|uniref:Uncharacterized protein n=1 Tax=Chara braunii TaxID=69332 RepID=A0A388KPH4_CHABU|nr:hypothetical protein CBR_g10891 [Chara braunii]|eukprot:GBG71954.1 hypothetical protein CBR_g10891 [Chara braunii]